jgi:hypothetical protein
MGAGHAEYVLDAQAFHEPDNQFANCYLHLAVWLPREAASSVKDGI